MMAILVAIMSSLFYIYWNETWNGFIEYEVVTKFTFLPGVLLIIIGIWKM